MFSCSSTMMSASTEFVDLCQSQMALLTQGLGAVWSAIYLKEGDTETKQTKLIPLVVYPPNSISEKEAFSFVGLPQIDKPLLLSDGSFLLQPYLDSNRREPSTSKLDMQKQIVLPLIYENLVLGLLITRREDRQWNEGELAQIEKIALTLAIACILDRRQLWQQQQLQQQDNLKIIERNRLDDLLHQLRNPLTALRTFSKLLLKRILPADRNYTVAQSILRESDRLEELLKQLEKVPTDTSITLNAASSILPEPTGNFLLLEEEFTWEFFGAEKVLEPLLVSASAIAAEKAIELEIKLAENLPLVRGNSKALTEVLSNLIDNALKYTPAGGKVTVETGWEKIVSSVKFQGIAISDTGYGIAKEDRDNLFQRHYRGVQAQGNIPGSGLGLAIAKQLVEKMQGTIELISPNTALQINTYLPGSTFIVWLTVKSDD